MSNNKLFNFTLKKNSDFIEIGGGEGELCSELINSGCKFILYAEPDNKKFKVARSRLDSIDCQNKDISRINFDQIKTESTAVSVIMQDVIEHIQEKKLKHFFDSLSSKYSKIYFIGRTPNLKSPFGLRNSFGDNTHIYRFTDKSLEDFLKGIGFKKITILNENYKVTGIISLLRFIPYFITIYSVSVKFAIVYGTWQGFLTPNITFHAEK